MARTALLPRSAPFEGEDFDRLDRLLTAASPVQRAWLSGFLAGLDNGAQPVAPAQASRPARALTILFASESGNAERLAQDAAKSARKSGFKPTIIDFADLDPATLAQSERLLVIASTWGEGEPPGRAAAAYRTLMGAEAPRLDGVAFGVLALGDTAYAEFCAVGRALDNRFAELGATRIIARVDCDLDFEAPAKAWIGSALAAITPEDEPAANVVAVDFGARNATDQNLGETSREPLMAEVVEHINLNSSRSEKETIHLALEMPGLAYEPGDSLELYPENLPALADEALRAVGLSADTGLRDQLLTERDITTLSRRTVETFAANTGHADAQALLEGDVRAWLEGRQLIDLLTAFPATLTAEQLLALTRPLPPRAYSIASSRKEVGDEAHLLVSAVRYQSHGRKREGVASTFVADRVKRGASVRARLKPNPHFRLPEPGRDIIMIGPGTGVAPFRAFVQERRAVGATGRNWLFFGDRHFTHDFLYQLEWQDALADGSLTRLDVAFSRDTPQKVYVQNRLWERRRDVVDWLEGGALLYVCGDAKAMAKDVRGALLRSLADVKALSPEMAEAEVARLERERRYRQDVY